MARVSYLRPAASPEHARAGGTRTVGTLDRARRRFGRGPALLLAALLLVIGGIAAAAVVIAGSKAAIESDPAGLARITLPTGGGTIVSVSATTGPHSRPVAVRLRGHTVYPVHRLSVHQPVTIDATVRRPGWISWLSGGEQHLQLAVETPAAHLASRYLTLRSGQPITLRFREPIESIAYGPNPSQLQHRALVMPLRVIHLHRTGLAGTLWVEAVPRTWEAARPTAVSWFPAGAAAGAVANPAPGTTIGPHTNLTLTFSKPVSQALGHALPPVTPAGAGSWRPINPHTISFVPAGYGYGLGAKVSVGLPAGVQLIGGAPSWNVPGGSVLRLQQLLSDLGYLPLRFEAAGRVPATAAAQELAAVKPPAGHFAWRYDNIPSTLRSTWSPGRTGVMTQGALMAFENDHGLTPDGTAGPVVWKALLGAALGDRKSTFGYTFVEVHKQSSPQSLTLWHNGKVVFSPPVNTGIASAPTASGTYPVFEHLPVTTMSGTNPDGSHYSDPGIRYVSYFNGGDALHAFTRGQYGFPQSLGCVEMDLASAAKVYPYTPIGTLVHVD